MRQIILLALAALLVVPVPLDAQESGFERVGARIAACTIFAGATAITADTYGEGDLGGLVLWLALGRIAGGASRYCMYGPRDRPATHLGRLCDETMDWMPLVGAAVYAGAGGDLEMDVETGLAIGGFGLIGGVVDQHACPKLGGPRVPGPMEITPTGKPIEAP